jgi:hypothetical protein
VHEWTLVVDCSFSSTPTLVGDLATGVIADYQFNSGTGTILVDNSGTAIMELLAAVLTPPYGYKVAWASPGKPARVFLCQRR